MQLGLNLSQASNKIKISIQTKTKPISSFYFIKFFIILFFTNFITIKSNNINETNINNNNNSTNSTNNPINTITKILNKTLIKPAYINGNISCRENRILTLLPKNLQTSLKSNLNDIPSLSNSNKCNLSKNDNNQKEEYLTCCSSNTITTIEDYINKDLIPLKKKIFANNIYYIRLIINEHKRNLIKGFGLTEKDFIFLFENFESFAQSQFSLFKKIITESINYTWDSLCNFICHPDFYKLFNTYNITTSKVLNNNNKDKNETISSEINFNILKNIQRTKNFTDLIKEYISNINDLDQNLEKIYLEIIEKSKKLNFKEKNNTLIIKSLIDGKNYFSSINYFIPCDKKKSNNFTYEDCETIIENQKICTSFFCLDDIFLQNFVKNFAHEIDYMLDDYYNYNYVNFTDNDFDINVNDLFRSFNKEINSVIKEGQINLIENNGFFLKSKYKFYLKLPGFVLDLIFILFLILI
jgi:hypothetical protein